MSAIVHVLTDVATGCLGGLWLGDRIHEWQKKRRMRMPINVFQGRVFPAVGDDGWGVGSYDRCAFQLAGGGYITLTGCTLEVGDVVVEVSRRVDAYRAAIATAWRKQRIEVALAKVP